MTYNLIDFKDLVTMWYNEFLPEAFGDKAVFIESAGIVYLNSVSLEPKKKDSIKFIANKVLEMSKAGNVNLFIQEPKPVNNIHYQQFLHLIETNPRIDEEHRNKILHLANRRYVPTSNDILISQDKNMDEFLDQVYYVLTKLSFPNTRFYRSQSLGLKDVKDVATSFFPRSALNIKGNYEGESIKVDSSNDVLHPISVQLMKGISEDSRTSNFIERSRRTLLGDIKKIV